MRQLISRAMHQPDDLVVEFDYTDAGRLQRLYPLHLIRKSEPDIFRQRRTNSQHPLDWLAAKVSLHLPPSDEIVVGCHRYIKHVSHCAGGPRATRQRSCVFVVTDISTLRSARVIIAGVPLHLCEPPCPPSPESYPRSSKATPAGRRNCCRWSMTSCGSSRRPRWPARSRRFPGGPGYADGSFPVAYRGDAGSLRWPLQVAPADRRSVPGHPDGPVAHSGGAKSTTGVSLPETTMEIQKKTRMFLLSIACGFLRYSPCQCLGPVGDDIRRT